MPWFSMKKVIDACVMDTTKCSDTAGARPRTQSQRVLVKAPMQNHIFFYFTRSQCVKRQLPITDVADRCPTHVLRRLSPATSPASWTRCRNLSNHKSCLPPSFLSLCPLATILPIFLFSILIWHRILIWDSPNPTKLLDSHYHNIQISRKVAVIPRDIYWIKCYSYILRSIQPTTCIFKISNLVFTYLYFIIIIFKIICKMIFNKLIVH